MSVKGCREEEKRKLLKEVMKVMEEEKTQMSQKVSGKQIEIWQMMKEAETNQINHMNPACGINKPKRKTTKQNKQTGERGKTSGSKRTNKEEGKDKETETL
jgi:hypothetical protein